MSDASNRAPAVDNKEGESVPLSPDAPAAKPPPSPFFKPAYTWGALSVAAFATGVAGGLMRRDLKYADAEAALLKEDSNAKVRIRAHAIRAFAYGTAFACLGGVAVVSFVVHHFKVTNTKELGQHFRVIGQEQRTKLQTLLSPSVNRLKEKMEKDGAGAGAAARWGQRFRDSSLGLYLQNLTSKSQAKHASSQSDGERALEQTLVSALPVSDAEKRQLLSSVHASPAVTSSTSTSSTMRSPDFVEDNPKAKHPNQTIESTDVAAPSRGPPVEHLLAANPQSNMRAKSRLELWSNRIRDAVVTKLDKAALPEAPNDSTHTAQVEVGKHAAAANPNATKAMPRRQ